MSTRYNYEGEPIFPCPSPFPTRAPEPEPLPDQSFRERLLELASAEWRRRAERAEAQVGSWRTVALVGWALLAFVLAAVRLAGAA